MRRLLIIALLCLVGPFVIMAGEYLFALLTSARGDRLYMAGAWGAFIGYYSIPLGLLLLLVASLFRRGKKSR